MATNQDFNNLINRIDTATSTLENNVQTLVDGSADIAGAVQEAQQAATTATQEAGNAGQSANTATQAASEAATSLQEVQGIIEDFEEANLIGEAPVNGQEYVRKDAEWVLNTGGDGGGGGDVVSVNGVLPDAQGDVSLDIPEAQVNSDWNATEGVEAILNKPELFSGDYDDLTNKPTIFSGDYDDLSNKPSIPTQGVESIVAGENITIDNTDPLNPVISSEGGGGDEGYPLNLAQDWWYDNDRLTHWPHVNPHNPIQLSKLGTYVTGRWREGMELLNYEASRNAFPVGTFYVSYSDDPVGGLGGLLRVSWSAEVNGTLVGKTFRYTPEPNTTVGNASPDYIAVAQGSNNLVWKPVVGEDEGGSGIEEAPNDGKQYARQNEGWTEVVASGGGGGGGFPLPPATSTSPRYNDVPLGDNYPYENPNQPLDFSKVKVYRGGQWRVLRLLMNTNEDVKDDILALPACNFFISNATINGEGYKHLVGRITHTASGSSRLPYILATEVNSRKSYMYLLHTPFGWTLAE